MTTYRNELGATAWSWARNRPEDADYETCEEPDGLANPAPSEEAEPRTQPIGLILVDSMPIVLKGLELLFSSLPDFRVVASCADGEQAVQAVRRHHPDLLVLELRLPRKDGLAVLQELQSGNLPTQAIVLTSALKENEMLEAIRLGARGVVLKEMAPQLLVHCLRKVHAGDTWLEKRSAGDALSHLLQKEAELSRAAGILTPREMQLVRLVARGLSNNEIGDQLHISEGTVKIHMHHIYEKLDIRNRVALTLYAREKGLT